VSQQNNIRIFQTADHECGYWRDRLARDLVLDPDDARLPAMYGHALMLGFRRSGSHIYRPNCIGCSACVPVRVPCNKFQPNRNQRRCLQRNADLHISITPAHRSDEVFGLYERYLNFRHAGAGMDEPEPVDFDNFLICQWSPTVFIEIREAEKLLAVAVTDVLADSFSAVYTFFDPDYAARSLGTFAILQQIEQAKLHNKNFLYLGFWLDKHQKMDYKRNFQPLEFMQGKQWRRFQENKQ
jgi:leucyl-tRNA---protein transferase